MKKIYLHPAGVSRDFAYGLNVFPFVYVIRELEESMHSWLGQMLPEIGKYLYEGYGYRPESHSLIVVAPSKTAGVMYSLVSFRRLYSAAGASWHERYSPSPMFVHITVAEYTHYVTNFPRFSEDIVFKKDETGYRSNVFHNLIFRAPKGLSWGYLGEGCADMALNILFLFTSERAAAKHFQEFKEEFVSKMPEAGGIIKNEEIILWLKSKNAPLRKDAVK